MLWRHVRTTERMQRNFKESNPGDTETLYCIFSRNIVEQESIFLNSSTESLPLSSIIIVAQWFGNLYIVVSQPRARVCNSHTYMI